MFHIQKEIEHIKKELVNDIRTLVNIPTIRDIKSASLHAPFGSNIQKGFAAFRALAKQKGFHVESFDGYAMHACSAIEETYIGVLAHIDVVEAGDLTLWNSNPFAMKEEAGILYGRGVNDDKGPLLAALYAMHLLMKQKLPMKYPIRLIVGGAEETTWECIKYYLKRNKQPICGFSPDGNFPIVNGEKGILQVCFSYATASTNLRIITEKRVNYVCDKLIVELDLHKDYAFVKHAKTIEKTATCIRMVYGGKPALSRHPQKGENAIVPFVKDFLQCPWMDTKGRRMLVLLHEQFEEDHEGKKSGLYAMDEHMGTTSVCPMSLNWHEHTLALCLDIRYNKATSEEVLMERLTQIATTYKAQLFVMRHQPLLYVDPDITLLQCLKQAYYKVMKEEAFTLSKGGASYARMLDNAVAFGATFPTEDPCVHMPNEHMSIASLLKACEIYYEALYLLAVDHKK